MFENNSIQCGPWKSIVYQKWKKKKKRYKIKYEEKICLVMKEKIKDNILCVLLLLVGM